MKTVVGLFETRDQARRAVAALRNAGIKPEEMSILMRERREAESVADDVGAGDATSTGALGGGVLGGVAGFLAGIGALAIPGIGPALAVGPILAALGGAGLGAATGGLIGALVESGVPEEEATLYQAGVERGGILLTVRVANAKQSRVRSILTEHGMRGLDEHRSLWQGDPHFRYDTPDERSTPVSTRKTDKTTETTDDDAAATAGGGVAGLAAGAAIGAVAGGPVGAAIGAGIGAVTGAATGAVVDYASAEPEFRRDFESGPYREQTTWEKAAPLYRYGWEAHDQAELRNAATYDEARSGLKSHWRGPGRFEDAEVMVRTAWERRAQARVDRGGQAVVPVVQEELRVGKRTVETGGVKVETRVTETPVQEQVHLHEERVKVERRPVDRPVTAADAAFQEGTLELRETAEEAVVSKRARVIEEVVISKEGANRTETVRDTVRRTDVDVRETPGTGKVVDTAYETFDTDFRTDYQGRYGTAYTYEQVTPAYRFGYNLGSDARDRGADWTTVEPEARRLWEERNEGTWEQFKDSVRYAWDKVSGRR